MQLQFNVAIYEFKCDKYDREHCFHVDHHYFSIAKASTNMNWQVSDMLTCLLVKVLYADKVVNELCSLFVQFVNLNYKHYGEHCFNYRAS